jgi:hypothetical protein
VDSLISSKRSKKGDSSDSDSSKGKRKAAASGRGKDEKTPKTAKFKEDIPNNEGKIASTKKHLKGKIKDSYADKAAKDIKKS